MILRYDRGRGRICCRWKEPATMRFQGREVVIDRQKTVSVRVSELGTINKRDMAAMRRYGRSRAVSLFHKALLRYGVFTKNYTPEACEVCGNRKGVRACFDPEALTFQWLCPMHAGALDEVQHKEAKAV